MGQPKAEGETSEERALADVATKSRAMQHDIFDKLTSKLIQRSHDTETPIAQAKGIANAATQQAFAPAESRAIATDIRAGRNPTGALVDMNLNRTQSKAGGEVNAGLAGKDLNLARTSQILSYGRGQATQAAGGLADVAGAAQRQAERDAEIAAANRAAIGEGVAGVAGLAGGLYKRKPPGINLEQDPFAPDMNLGRS